MRRRTLLIGSSLLALLGAPCARAATAVNYSVNYAGDFTTLAAAFSGIGTDLTASSSGNTVQSGCTTTSIVLAASETLDFTGHPITIGGATCLIIAYNTSTKTATIGARAGYSAAFGAAPAAGTAYSIAAASAVLTIGQSAAGTNSWAATTTLTLSATTSSTCTLTLQGATPWNSTLPLRLNTGGLANQAVCIINSDTAGSGALTITSANVTINDLGIYNTQAGGSATGINNNSAGVVALNRCYVQTTEANSYGACLAGSNAFVAKNCVLVGCNVWTSGGAAGANIGYGCTLISANSSSWAVLARQCVFYGVAFFGFGGDEPYGDCTNYNCATDVSTNSGGISLILPYASTFNSNSVGTFDLRPTLTSGLLSAGVTNSNLLTDIFGVTRSATAPTIGAAEQGFGPPATKTVTYAIGAGGDIVEPAPNGLVSNLTTTTGAAGSSYTFTTNAGASTTVTLSSGITTLTTQSPHGMPVGLQVLLTIGAYTGASSNAYSNTFGGWASYSVYQATVTGADTMTFPDAFNPATLSPTGLQWVAHRIMHTLGDLAADLTYYQAGLTCPSTAANSSQIVLDPSVTAACVGHPIQWKSGAVGLITGFSGGVATISAIASSGGVSFPATFGGTPQAGDAYTIFPMSVVYNFGAPSSGHTIYAYDVFFPNAAVYNINAVTSPNNTITFNGMVPFDPTAALGTITDGVSAIALKCGSTNGALSDHTAMIGLGCGNITFNQLQFWDAGTSEGDGCFLANSSVTVTAPINVNKCLLRGDNWTQDHAHMPFVGQSAGAQLQTMIFANCAMNNQSYYNQAEMGDCSVVLDHCTLCNTADAYTTTVGDTPAGSTTITVASVTDIQGDDGTPAGTYLAVPSLPGAIATGTNVTTISGNVLTLSAPTTADIPGGTSIMGGDEYVNGYGNISGTNSAFFGTLSPAVKGASTSSFTSCLAECNNDGYSGIAIADYQTSLRLASEAFGGKIDLRPLPGNQLQVGTYMPSIPTDIYGNIRRNPPTVGAVENVIAGSPMQTIVG